MIIPPKSGLITGQVPQFYVEGDHDAIIPPDTFRRVQDELERRKDGHATGGSIFSGKTYCGECGQIYGSKVWHSNDPYRRTVWQCNDKFKGEKKCGTPTLSEEKIKKAFEKLLVKLKDDEVVKNLRGIKAGNTAALEAEKKKLEFERDAAARIAQEALDEDARLGTEKSKEPLLEYDRLELAVKEKEREIENVKAQQRRINEFVKTMEKAGQEFQEDLWASLVEKVTVFQDCLVFTLACGREIRV